MAKHTSKTVGLFHVEPCCLSTHKYQASCLGSVGKKKNQAEKFLSSSPSLMLQQHCTVGPRVTGSGQQQEAAPG